MRILAFILTLVAIGDITASIIKLMPERKILKKAWKHNKRQFIPLIYHVMADILVVLVFMAYISEGVA